MAQPSGIECAMFSGDCPRCGQVQTTFDVRANTFAGKSDGLFHQWECFLQCRSCLRPSIGLLRRIVHTEEPPTKFGGKYVNVIFELVEWIFEVPNRRRCPDHVSDDVRRIFEEAASCAAISAWDASGTMFRKALDVATRAITPTPDAPSEPRPGNWKTYKDLRLRLDWLFEHHLLSPALKDLSSCIHEDGNDAAHDAAGLGQAEAEDLGDFSESVLESIYTLPGQIAENKKRREQRRGVLVE